MGTISILQFGSTGFGNNMAHIKTRWAQNECHSKYNDMSTSAGNAISHNLWKAVCLYHSGKGFVGKTSSGTVAEILSADGQVRQMAFIKKLKTTQQYRAAIASAAEAPGQAILQGYTVASKLVSGFHGTVFLLALMPEILKDAEAKSFYDDLIPYVATADDTDPAWLDDNYLDAFSKALCYFTDNVYRRTTKSSKVDADVRLYLPTDDKNIKMLHMADLSMGVIPLAGAPVFFQNIKGSANAADDAEIVELKEKLMMENIDYSQELKNKIPAMFSGYQWCDWVIKAAKYIKLSTKYAEPIRTCYFIEPSGCGKSLGAAAIASLLGLAFDLYTCQADTELFDFMGQIFPNTNPTEKVNFEDIRIRLGLPSVDDIVMDPDAAVPLLFETVPDYVDESILINELVNRVNKEMSTLCASSDYTYVEGGLVKALRYGYAFEIQEIGIVKRPGVAVGLNAVLESGKNAFITLPTGEIIKKHPNCTILFTSNDEYEGTGNLNQSVLSRMGHVVWFKNSPAEEMAKRTKAKVFDFPDDKLLLEMANTIQEITAFCANEGITDGVCGQRELDNWAMEIMMELEMNELSDISDEIIRETCQTAVLNKVSQNSDDIASVAEGCVNSKYGEWDVRI